jgi:hypothetical protein
LPHLQVAQCPIEGAARYEVIFITVNIGCTHPQQQRNQKTDTHDIFQGKVPLTMVVIKIEYKFRILAEPNK